MGTKRIAINVMATSMQTAVSFIVGVFSSRWAYNALGETQFGLFAVVGAVIAFIAIINNATINASSRFFSYAVGHQRDPNSEKELLCKWFNTALSVQLILPIILILIGGPLGIYYVLYYLEIPDDSLRMPCVWVFVLSLFTMFQTMLFSPVQSLYYAMQYIFVRNIVAICNTFLMAAGGWWLLHYEGNRFLTWAVFCAAVALLNNIVFVLIAYWQFPAARIRLKYWFDRKRLTEMLSFSSFGLVGDLGALFSNSGVAIVLNKFLGPAANAAMSIGNQVNQKINIFSQAFTGAIQPELITRVGAGDFDGAQRLAHRACFYSYSLSLLFVAPFMVYAQKLLVLWFKSPPVHASEIAVIMMASLLVERVTVGYYMLVTASGRIKVYTTTLGIGNAGRCFIVLALLWWGLPLIPTLWLGLFLPLFILNQCRVLFAKYTLGAQVSIRHYLKKILLPVSAMSLISIMFSFSFKTLYGDGVFAMLMCLTINILIVAILFWLLVGSDERKILLSKITPAINLFRH